jgi:AraC-like DNA-binding protein
VLVATSETRIGTAGAHSTLVLERAVRGHAIRRDALAFDTRFSAAAAARAESAGYVFLLLAGRLVSSRGDTFAAPVAVVLADEEIESVGPASRTFRTDGEHVHVVQLRFDRRHLRVPVGLDRGPIALIPGAWDAAAAMLDGARRGDAAVLAAVLDVLAASSVITGDVIGTLCADEPERFVRLWSALQPLYATYGATLSIKQLASSLGMSMRQVGRDAKELTETFGLGGGFRDALLMVRLRMATLMLAARDATVADVAKLIGYGSPIAMARAFRDAGLPSPSTVQAAIRTPANTL